VLWSSYDYSTIWSARPSTAPPPQSPHSQMSPLSSSGEISKGLGSPSRGGGSGPKVTGAHPASMRAQSASRNIHPSVSFVALIFFNVSHTACCVASPGRSLPRTAGRTGECSIRSCRTSRASRIRNTASAGGRSLIGHTTLYQRRGADRRGDEVLSRWVTRITSGRLAAIRPWS
jgi:hypothetical protein